MSNERLRMIPDHFKVSGDRAFYSLQGEGISMGEPSVFLRLHFCNLRCSWCDTPYAVFPEREDYQTEPENWSIDDTVKTVTEMWGAQPGRQKRLVITGGEPLIQKDKIDLLIDRLPDWKIEIETNGTVMPTDKQLARCRFNCSPKLENSGNPSAKRLQPDVVRAIAQAESSFKFVVTRPEDLDEIERDYVIPMGIPVEKVILMPEGRDVESLRVHGQAVAEYAKKKGYRLLGRLQVDLYGNTRRT